MQPRLSVSPIRCAISRLVCSPTRMPSLTIGHRCVVHACTVGNNVRIGIGAVVLTGAIVEDDAQVGAGAVVPPGKVVRAGTLVMGVPAMPVRQMGADELDDIRRNAREYLDLWHRDYRGGVSKVIG